MQTEGIAHPAPQPATVTQPKKKKAKKTAAKPKKRAKKIINQKLMKVKEIIKKKMIKKMMMKAPKKKKPARDSTLSFPLPMVSKFKRLTALTSQHAQLLVGSDWGQEDPKPSRPAHHLRR